MMQIDLQSSFLVGSTMATLARRRLLAASPDWLARTRIVVLAFSAIVFAWPRGIPLVVEILASGAGAVVLALIVYRLLTPAERQMLTHAPVDWLRSRSTAPVQ